MFSRFLSDFDSSPADAVVPSPGLAVTFEAAEDASACRHTHTLVVSRTTRRSTLLVALHGSSSRAR
jgi:hypothetical protein